MSYITFHDISYANSVYNMDADPNPIIFMKMSGYYYGSKTPYYDDQAARNYQNAIRTNKVPGLYHFAGGADPVAEADFFIGACSPLAEGDIMILDYELTGEMNPPADPADWCLKFVERVKERTGKYPLFYTYYAMLKQYGFSEVLKRCGLWVAHYGYTPDKNIPNCPPYIIHQYQGSPLDTNACFISLDTLKKYGYSATEPQPDPPISTPIPNPVVNPDPIIEPPITAPVETTTPDPVIDTPIITNPPEKDDNMLDNFNKYNKFWVALTGAVMSLLTIRFGSADWLPILVSFLTAIGVYGIENEKA